LFGRTPGQTSSGTLRLISPDGGELNVLQR
jgi:hypothetical protein